MFLCHIELMAQMVWCLKGRNWPRTAQTYHINWTKNGIRILIQLLPCSRTSWRVTYLLRKLPSLIPPSESVSSWQDTPSHWNSLPELQHSGCNTWTWWTSCGSTSEQSALATGTFTCRPFKKCCPTLPLQITTYTQSLQGSVCVQQMSDLGA